MTRRNILLLVALVIEAAAIEGIALLGDLRVHVLAFVLLFMAAAAAFLFAFRLLSDTESFAGIVVIAVALRLPLLFTQPSLSDDVWRYLHDGRAQLAGQNPFAYAPADARTKTFRGPEFERINHRELVTIYPPTAQFAFAVNALFGSTLLGWRIMLICAELITMIMLARLLERRGIALRNLALYAWHPLAVIEGVGSGHLEPIGIGLLVAGIWAAAQSRELVAGALLGLSIGIKLVTAPLMLVTQQIRRPALIAAATFTLFLVYAIYWVGGPPFGSLGIFALSWEANSSIYSLLASLTDGYRARILAVTLLVCIIVMVRATQLRDEQRMALCMLGVLLLSPVVHPWYLLWLLVFVPMMSITWLRWAALLWSVTVVVAYLPLDLRVVEYVPVYAVLAVALVKAVRRGSLQRTLRPLAGRTQRTAT